MSREITVSAPVLVFGGPYSNLHALRALMARAETLAIAPANVICTGDIAAYCADAEATLQAVRAWGCHVVAGNCEEQLAQNADDCGCGFEDGTLCNRLSQDWYTFARQQVSGASRAWMASLPLTITFNLGGKQFHVVHGGMRQSNRFVFASDRAAFADEFRKTDADVVIAGHAGLPFIAQQEGRTWFNPGVIGMPANDGTADVWYGLIRQGDDTLALSTHRLNYDAPGAAAAMRTAGLADDYARALTTGLWPSLDVLPVTERAAAGQSLGELSIRLNTSEHAV
jgi:predicted phosphodiesterase